MIQVNYNRQEFTLELQKKLDAATNPRAVLMASGREVGNQLKDWFRKKDRDEPNKLSPRREHFWLQVSRSVQNPVIQGARTVSVTINDPRIAQKVFGGTITAKRAGALTIPVSEKAYGRTAATFERETGLKLFLLKKKTGTPGRGQTGPSNLERAVLAAVVNGHIEVEYLLTKSVTQGPDADALPPEKDLEAAILKRAQAVVDRQNETTKENS
jgi:hypothetical protein